MYILIGSFPPPLGGVSIYCSRRYELLRRSGENVRIVNTSFKFSSIFRLSYYSLRYRFSNVTYELNSSNIIMLLLIMFLGISKKTVFVDHNSSRRVINNNLSCKVFHYLTSRFSKIKVVNSELKKNYRRDVQRKISTLSPFLPPSDLEMEVSKNQLKPFLTGILNSEERNIVITSAWRPVNTLKEPDLYGILDCLAVYQQLIKKYPQYIFVLMIGEMAEDELSHRIRLLVVKLSRFKNFCFICGGLSQLALLPKTKLLLRLTKTDGDSVSVREAIYFGANVVCSNVVTRPANVATVPLNDTAELMAKIKEILDGK